VAVIQVFRGAGDKVGKPIVVPILAENVLLDRGIHEMNVNASNKVQVSANIVYRTDLSLGQLVGVSDPSNNLMYKAKIVGMKLSLANGEVNQSITLERHNELSA
jgi:hypothetical protein